MAGGKWQNRLPPATCNLLYDILNNMFDIQHLKSLILNDPVLGVFAKQAIDRGIKIYLVGGYVRDALLGKDVKDADLMFEGKGNAEAIGNYIAEKFGTTLVRFEKHMIVYRITANGHQYDFADLIDTSITDDLLRRDFTVNSLAVELGELFQYPERDKVDILDASSGLDDLKDSILRINSRDVLRDDALRVMRLFRFETQLGFKCDEHTLKAIPDYVAKLSDISGERVRDELFQILARPQTAETFLRMESVGILSHLFPLVGGMKGVEQNFYHHFDVFEHTIEAVRCVETVLRFDDPVTSEFAGVLNDFIRREIVGGRPRFALLKLAALLHDIGKPLTKETRPDGRITFIGHDKAGTDLIEPYLEYLHLSRHEVQYINTVVAGHLHPGFLDPDQASLPKSIFRYFDSHDEIGIDIVLMSLADRMATRGPMSTPELVERHNRIAVILLDAYFNRNKLLVRPEMFINGDDLMRELNLPPGKEIGILLKIVKEGQAIGEISSYAEAIDYARRFLDKLSRNDKNS